jgi:hypothetical protein
VLTPYPHPAEPTTVVRLFLWSADRRRPSPDVQAVTHGAENLPLDKVSGPMCRYRSTDEDFDSP